jgi:hypothetical protein
MIKKEKMPEKKGHTAPIPPSIRTYRLWGFTNAAPADPFCGWLTSVGGCKRNYKLEK